jgi:hypothetical protein
MSKSVNQHWVPKFYLREFATPETRQTKEPKVWIFSKQESDGSEQLTNVRNVCAKRYLYSPRDESGQRSWEIDDELQRVESLLAQIWPQVASDFIDLGNESIRKALALFVATAHVRHPDNREALKSLHSQIVEGLDNLPKKSDGSPNVDSYLYKGQEIEIDTSGWKSYKEWTEDAHHRFFAQTIRVESGNLAKILLKKRWSVVLAEREHFITSDRPVAVQHTSREVFGVGTAGGVVSFPLSPTRILILDDQHQEPANQYYPLKPENVGAFNYNVWHTGARFMVTGRHVPEVLAEIVGWADNEEYA